MRNNTEDARRAFVLPPARVYVPGALPEEVYRVASKGSAGGCCGAPPAPNQEESSGCGTSSCGTD